LPKVCVPQQQTVELRETGGMIAVRLTVSIKFVDAAVH